ncbi:MAG: thioesterase [Acidimicrobiia bacterium]|nr:thioesterase [Acidimicrobiia bacterium]
MEIGSIGTADMMVTASDTAIAMRSGDVEVVGTPRLVALAEEATLAAVAVAAGQTSVGTRIELDHLLPSRIGQRLTATARLDEQLDRDLHFSIEILDGNDLVARGLVTRVVVDRNRFAR